MTIEELIKDKRDKNGYINLDYIYKTMLSLEEDTIKILYCLDKIRENNSMVLEKLVNSNNLLEKSLNFKSVKKIYPMPSLKTKNKDKESVRPIPKDIDISMYVELIKYDENYIDTILSTVSPKEIKSVLEALLVYYLGEINQINLVMDDETISSWYEERKHYETIFNSLKKALDDLSLVKKKKLGGGIYE